MIAEIVNTLKKEYAGRSIEELLTSWRTKNTAEESCTLEGFEAIRQILAERGVDVPTQTPHDWTNDLQLSSATMNEITSEVTQVMPFTRWDYGAARSVAKFISFSGWVIVGICIIAILVTLIKSNILGSMMLIPSFIAGAVAGFLMVAVGQLLRANVDNADNTGQILALIKAWSSEKNMTKQ